MFQRLEVIKPITVLRYVFFFSFYDSQILMTKLKLKNFFNGFLCVVTLDFLLC